MAKTNGPSWPEVVRAINDLRDEYIENTKTLIAYIDKKVEDGDKVVSTLSDEKDKSLNIKINVLWASFAFILVSIGGLAFFIIQSATGGLLAAK